MGNEQVIAASHVQQQVKVALFFCISIYNVDKKYVIKFIFLQGTFSLIVEAWHGNQSAHSEGMSFILTSDLNHDKLTKLTRLPHREILPEEEPLTYQEEGCAYSESS